MTDQELKQIEARANAATPGKWKCSADADGEFCILTHDRKGELLGAFYDEGDAEFIAHAREDIPKLITEIRRLRGSVAIQNPDWVEWPKK